MYNKTFFLYNKTIQCYVITINLSTMYNLDSIIIFLVLSSIAFTIYFSIQRRNKFKTAAYNISTHSKESLTEYYLVVEMRHGQFLDARKLSIIEQLFIPNHIVSLLRNTYNDYESAEKSLQELKEKN